MAHFVDTSFISVLSLKIYIIIMKVINAIQYLMFTYFFLYAELAFYYV